MKKIVIFGIALTLCIALAGCGGNSSASRTGDVVEIGDKLFIQRCTDLYTNPDDYKNALVKIEGICDVWEENGETRYAVYRRTPGCCGDDGVMGFTFFYSGERQLALNDWISVTAEVITGEDDFGYATVNLNATDVTVSDVRGIEFVTT